MEVNDEKRLANAKGTGEKLILKAGSERMRARLSKLEGSQPLPLVG